MIACNSHGQPSLDPRNPCETPLILPNFYLDLLFGDLPAETPTDAEVEPEELAA